MIASPSDVSRAERWHWLLTGQIQGVGFRPHVYRIAREQGLRGFVRNDGDSVVIEAQGAPAQLAAFEDRLIHDLPAHAHVASAARASCAPRDDEDGFVIAPSAPGAAPSRLTPDLAVCDDCLRELLEPSDRRHRHPLITCTHCGPRFSIVRGVPYDRERTTLRGFQLCPACAAEYHDPQDRRFHAQPIACHDCGPTWRLGDARGGSLPGDPAVEARRLLDAGRVVAIKGVGGFHLAVRADDEACILRLRGLKHRDAKPLAVLAWTLEQAERLVRLTPAGLDALQSSARPIVLAQRRGGAELARSLAPGTHRLGVMLPYTPIHHLLLRAAPAPPPPIVLTSANCSDEPLLFRDEDAPRLLAGLCDAVLTHDRPIARGVDDSVVLDLPDGPLPIRRARGYVPQPIRLPVDGGGGLALGGELKATVARVSARDAVLSQHLGDLAHARAFEAFVAAIDDLLRLYDGPVRWIAHDRHPAYASTRHAAALAERLGAPRLDVQHHHAHAAALLAEHGLTGPILAIVCDGTGYGDDGTIWGGEILRADLRGFQRLGRLTPLALAGGDAAARDTRRCALSLLRRALGDAAVDHPAARRLLPDDAERGMLDLMLRRGTACALSCGAGRVFDAVAALLGLCLRNRHEAEAGMALEAAAFAAGGAVAPLAPMALREVDGLIEIDAAPLALDLADRAVDGAAGPLARAFHERFADALSEAALRVARTDEPIGLSGGVFCNELLTVALTARLESRGRRVLRHRRVPANDGGLALGQAAVAAARQGGV